MVRKIDQEELPPLGQAIMRLIEARGFKTLKEACEAGGVNYLHCRYIVRGEKTPRPATLREVIAKLDGDFAEFEGLVPKPIAGLTSTAKRVASFRISNETREQLAELKKRLKGTTEGAIVERAIHELHERMKGEKKKGKGIR